MATADELALAAVKNLRRRDRIIGASGSRFDLGYTPSTPGDWAPVPDTVWSALDQVGAGAGGLAAHLIDAADAHDASAISFAPAGGIAAINVQAALAELDSEKAASSHSHGIGDLTFDVATQAELDFVSGALASHIAAATAAHAASAISVVPAGGQPEDDVQAAIDHLQSDIGAVQANLDAVTTINSGNVLGNVSGTSPLQVTAVQIGDGLAVQASPAAFYNPHNYSNVLINGGGDFWQRQTPGTDASRADAAYAADRWYVLTQSNPINVKRIAGDKTLYAHRLTQSDASAQRIGYAQWVENANCVHLQGRDISFQGKVRISNSQAVRFALIGWSGAADSPTKDVVNDWTSSTYTDGNFFISSDFDVIVVGSLTPSASTWTNFSTAFGSVGAYNNYGVIFWTEGTAAQNVTLDLAELQLLPDSASTGGAVFKSWLPRPGSEELALCQRYYEKSFPVDTIPDDSATANLSANYTAAAFTTGLCSFRADFKVPKRNAGYTTTIYQPEAGTSAGLGAFFAPGAAAFFDFTSQTVVAQTQGFTIIGARVAGFTAGTAVLARAQWTVDGEL